MMRAAGQWSTLVEGVRLGGLVKTEDGIQQSLGGWGLCSSLTGGTLTGAFEKSPISCTVGEDDTQQWPISQVQSGGRNHSGSFLRRSSEN